jgi:hypothetical protein
MGSDEVIKRRGILGKVVRTERVTADFISALQTFDTLESPISLLR